LYELGGWVRVGVAEAEEVVNEGVVNEGVVKEGVVKDTKEKGGRDEAE